MDKKSFEETYRNWFVWFIVNGFLVGLSIGLLVAVAMELWG